MPAFCLRSGARKPLSMKKGNERIVRDGGEAEAKPAVSSSIVSRDLLTRLSAWAQSSFKDNQS